MEIDPPLVAHGQATEAIEPGQRALDDPAVTPKALARVNATACDARDNAACAAHRTMPQRVIALVGVQLTRVSAWPAASPTGLPDWPEGRPASLRAGASHARWPPRASPRGGDPSRRPQHGASCPVCRDPSASDRS